MVVKVAGNSIDSNEVQPSKKLTGSVFCVTGRLIDLSFEQYINAHSPSERTDDGSTIVSSKFMFLQM